MIIGLGLGCSTTKEDFKIAFGTPKAIGIGFLSQYFIMPVCAYLFSIIFNLTENQAVGCILIGCSPGGTTSNLFTYWSKGNTALSITMSFCSTMAAFFMLPLLIFLLLNLAYDLEDITIPWFSIIASLLLILIPCCGGLYLRHKNTEYKIKDKFIWQWVESLMSILGFIFLIGAFVTSIMEQGEEIISANVNVWITGAILQPLGCFVGYYIAKKLNQTRQNCRTIALETGVQNFTLTIALITLAFNGTQRNEILVYPLVYGFMYIINSFWIVCLLRYVIAPSDGDDYSNNESKIRGINGSESLDFQGKSEEGTHYVAISKDAIQDVIDDNNIVNNEVEVELTNQDNIQIEEP
jgi:BASS family bile acid:Na+ symporter